MNDVNQAGALRSRNSWPARCLVAVLLLLIANTGIGVTASAGNSASLTVGARLRAWARIDNEVSPARLVLTEADVARGWIDLPDATYLDVRTNSAAGYVLRFRLEPTAVVFAELPDVPEAPVFGVPGGDLARNVAGPTRDELTLSWRLHLKVGARPGVVAWPISVGVLPRLVADTERAGGSRVYRDAPESK